MQKRIWCYDLETLDIFTATFLDANSEEVKTFVYSSTKNQVEELFLFLENEVLGLIGYNCINFDWQIIEYIYRNKQCTPDDIRRYAQIITSSDEMPEVPEWRFKIPNLDLYRIHHFDNKNRRISLKWCEYMMDLDNIEDMPSQGEGSNWEEMVLSYNLNDVIATKELYKRSTPLIQLRKELSKLYNINLRNASNSKIGSELLLKLYCQKTGKYHKDVRSLRTFRKEIKIKDVIFPYISFKSVEFNLVLSTFRKMIITKTKKEEEISQVYKNFEFVYGKGGIHGSLSSCIIEADNDNIILDLDVASLYPSIAIVNQLYPQHLGLDFCNVYKNDIVDVRLAEKAKKEKGNKAIVEGFKEAANATYGKSNDFYSWLYDPQYTMATTINGQLMLTMLAENLMDIPNCQLIQINTDGLTIKIPKNQKAILHSICQEWMDLTKLQLEEVEYSKMIIWDVNNYLGFYTNNKYKAKGRCEFENIPLHKNKSFSIIPYAVYKYFKDKISVEETILNHKNIFDFCAGKRAKQSEKRGKSRYELHWFENGEIKKQKLSKTVRYYISKKGKTLFKVYDNGQVEQVEAPEVKGKQTKYWQVTYFNKAFYPNDFEEYNINYDYYITEARKWIQQVEKKESLMLF